MKRFVGLDGIKGLALIAIVLYHCMQQRLPGGFYGVDVFFTVSGFLIAVSLIRSLAKTGSLNLVRYIPKRAVRLYPALFLLIPVIVSVGWLFDHDILVSIRDQVITVLLGCYNWYAIAGGQSCGIPGYRARIRPIVSRITIHWPSFYNVVTGKTLALPNLIALQHIPLSPAGVIAKRPAPIALPNSCAAEWRMAPDAVFSPYASVRYFTPHMVHSQYNLL